MFEVKQQIQKKLQNYYLRFLFEYFIRRPIKVFFVI